MMGNINPRQIKGKEYESNLGLFRLSKNMTIHDFCKECGINQSDYSSLNNGTKSPFRDSDGELSKTVKKIIKRFNIDIEDIFPRYACKLRYNFLTNDQIVDISHSKQFNINAKFLHEDIDFVLKSLKKRERYIIKEMFYNEKTLESIAIELSITRERVRQISLKALRKLRHPDRTRNLKLWAYDMGIIKHSIN